MPPSTVGIFYQSWALIIKYKSILGFSLEFCLRLLWPVYRTSWNFVRCPDKHYFCVFVTSQTFPFASYAIQSLRNGVQFLNFFLRGTIRRYCYVCCKTGHHDGTSFMFTPFRKMSWWSHTCAKSFRLHWNLFYTSSDAFLRALYRLVRCLNFYFSCSK